MSLFNVTYDYHYLSMSNESLRVSDIVQSKIIELNILPEEMKMAIILVLFLGAMYIIQRKK